MAKIKKIKEGTATVYPATIPQAVIDPTSGKSVRTELNEKEAVANKKQTVTNSATDYPSGAAVTASLALKTDIAELNKIYPLYNYNVRVGTDSGSIGNIEELAKLYNENLALLDSTVFLWSGVSGMKTRTSGSNVFASKLYNMANKVQQFGSELVTNGTFTGADGSTPAGWTGLGANLTIDTNRLKVYNTSGYSGAHTSFATVIGKTYHFSCSFTYVDCRGEAKVANVIGGVALVSRSLSANASLTLSFVATATTTFISLVNLSGDTGLTTIWDNISVKQMDWVEGTNDAVQTTEANQLYVGGVIAPNEVRSVKNLSTISNFNIQNGLSFSSNDKYSITFSLTPYDTSAVIGRITRGAGVSQIRRNGARLEFINFQGTSVFFSDVFKPETNVLFTLVSTGSGVLIFYKNGQLIASGTVETTFQIATILDASSAIIGKLTHAQVHNRALSASEIQAQHDYLRLQIPEIEGIAIGNQYWQTSNYEGVVAGDGSVIQEVQNSDNVEKSGSLAAWRVINALGSTGSVSGNTLNFTNAVEGYPRFDKQSLTVGKCYYVSITLSGDTSRITQVRLNDGGTLHNIPKINNNLYQGYQIAGKTMIEIVGTNGVPYSVTVESLSVQEVGWSQSTALYDAVYAQTSGTTAVKELAALKAAAMWCYYNNDVNNGAIYGKLLNGYAAKLISLYPPQGWRAPTSSDFTQLQNYLGGSTVAGGKMKALFREFNNSFSTNESGFSAIANGRRDADGSFGSIDFLCVFKTSTIDGALNGYEAILYKTDKTLVILSQDNRRGSALRLLRNSPVGPNERTIASTTIVSDISSTANSTQIPFGYSVASIRLKTTANLTNIKVELWNNFYSGTPTLVATLITGKTANNTTMVFPVLADVPSLLQDGTLRITATGANTFETVVEYNLQKNTF